MAFSGDRIQDSTAGKAAAYSAYILGGSVFVGLYRLALSIYYIAKHSICAQSYQNAYKEKVKQFEAERKQREQELNQKKNERGKENTQAANQTRQAENELKKAKGTGKIGARIKLWSAQASEFKTKAVNKAKNTKDTLIKNIEDTASAIEEEVKTTALASFEELENAKKNAWHGELVRAIVEVCLPVIGAAAYTAYDLKHKHMSVLGLKELSLLKEIDDLFDFNPTALKFYF